MKTESNGIKYLSPEVRRLISGVITFLNGKDKEYTEKIIIKGDNK